MKTAKLLMNEETWAEFGTDPREEVMTLERIILQTIKFDFIVEHPYAYLLKYAKCLKGRQQVILLLNNKFSILFTFSLLCFLLKISVHNCHLLRMIMIIIIYCQHNQK